MPATCEACGGEIEADATRCPACGLAFLAPAKDDPLSPQGVPRHVEFYVGDAPRVVAAPDDGVAVETIEPPPRPLRAGLPSHERRWRLIVVVLGLFAAGAVVVAVLSLRRRADSYDAQEKLYERFARSELLDPVAPPDVRSEAEEDATCDAATLRAARAAYRPLPAPRAGPLHEFFDAFLERLIEIDPLSALSLGLRPRTPRPFGQRRQAEIELRLLYRDASRALRSWPATDASSPHDRADRDALLADVDSFLAWRPTHDLSVLGDVSEWLLPLQRAADVPTWPVEERIAVATAIVDDIPERLSGDVADLVDPPAAGVLAEAVQLADADDYLATYGASWSGASATSTKALDAAIARARPAVATCVARLRGEVLNRANGPLGVGRENLAVLLRTKHRLPLDPRGVYEHALDELHAAHADMRRLWPSLRGQAGGISDVSDEAQVRELRAACADWVPAMPSEERLVVVTLPKAFADRHVAATYEDAGTLAPTDAGVVHVSPPRPPTGDTDRGFSRLSRRHTLAHETYPGHRMDHVLRRDACALRRFVDDRVFVEGWAVYAEELLHETGRCDGGPCDDYVRASRRASHARSAMMEILAATGAATDEEIAALMRASGWPDAGLQDVGARTSTSCYSLTYFLGLDEIRRLRRGEETRLGAAFDLRAFHAKLLAEGPIPPRLIEEEWNAVKR